MRLVRLYEKYHSDRKLQKRVIGRKNFTYRIWLELLEKYGKGKSKVLDVGSGVGTVDFYLASKGKYVLGVEISKNAYLLAKNNAKLLGLDGKIQFLNEDFLHVALHKRYNLIVCSEVLEHLSDDKKVLSKISRLLDKKGILILSVPSKNAPLYRLGLLKKFDKKVGHLRRYLANDVAALVEEAGLRVVESQKLEGLFRNFLFTHRLGNFIVRLANRLTFLSDLFAFADKISMFLFGEATIYVVARKQ